MKDEKLLEQLYTYLISEKNKEVPINNIKKIVGKYTTTQILNFLDEISVKYGVNIYFNKENRLVSFSKKEGFENIYNIVRTIKIGFISNSRLLSNYSSISALYAAYKIFETEGVIWINCVGGFFNDTIAYKRSPSKLEEYIEEMEDFDKRIEYISKIFPQIPYRKTHVYPSKRDIALFKNEGGKLISRDQIDALSGLRNDIKREDREYQDVYGTNVRIYLISAHDDDGVSSTYTYDAQERVEKINFDKNYVNIVVIGGYHVPFILSNYSGADLVISLPSLIFQTPYMKVRRKTYPTIGCCILEILLDKEKKSVRDIKVKFYNLKKYAKFKDFYKIPEIQNPIEKKIVSYLFEKGSCSLGEMSRLVNLSTDEIIKTIEAINSKYNIRIYEKLGSYYIQLPFEYDFKLPSVCEGEKSKFLLLSDTHLNSVDVDIKDFEYIIKKARENNVDAILHAGDIIEAIPGAEIFEGQRFEINTRNAKEIKDFLFKIFDMVKENDIPFFFITGNHDEKLRKQIGLDVMEMIAELYNNPLINYVGSNRGSVEFKGLELKLIHPSGGSAQALGTNARRFYRYIKFIKGKIKKTIGILGNYHKAMFIYDGMYFPLYLVPSLKYPDEFSTTRGLPYQRGAWLVTIEYDDNDILSVENSFLTLPFLEKREKKEIKVGEKTFYISEKL
ncbi:MAG: metallophosphoesterase [Candidatus Aenigmatarchaeota archaeon]